MNNHVRLLGLSLVLAVMAPSSAPAQFFEVLSARLNGVAVDPFGCAGVPCNLYERLYPDKDPTLINGPLGPVDGFPDYRPNANRYAGDQQNTSNYPGFNTPTAACEAWYAVWTGVQNPGSGIYISYYSAQSTIVNVSETGNSNNRDCNTVKRTFAQACFGATDPTSAVNASTGTPQGDVVPIGGLEPVPVPTVVNSAVPDTVQLAWPSANNQNTTNRPSANNTPCPAGSTFDDLLDQNGPNPIWGLRLYVHTIPDGGAFRSLASLEGTTLVGTRLGVLENPGNMLSCTGQLDCPNVHLVPCSTVTGGICQSDGVSFTPAAQIVTLDKATIDSLLTIDGPIGTANNAVFNTKVIFRGAVPGSQAAAGVPSSNPSLVSLFSANSTRVSFGALVAQMVFQRTRVEGNRVTLNWVTTTSGSFLEFRLERADPGVVFQPLATIPATEATSYSFTDIFRGRRSSRALYRLIGVEAAPTPPFQIFTTVTFNQNDRTRRFHTRSRR
ncbi:MAG: hypothetical protein ACE5ID_00100 [Acidobacteriota bacterium]